MLSEDGHERKYRTTEEQVRKTLDQAVDTREFRDASLAVSRFLHKQVLNGGEPARELADALHGKQLGHALHPALTAVTIGSWTTAFIYDILSFLPGFKSARKAADTLTFLGIISAAPTALTGLTDYTTIKKEAAHYGAVHAMLNSLALIFYTKSMVARLRGSRMSGRFFSLLGLSILTFSGWIGGELVYRYQIATNHGYDEGPEDWTQVLAADALAEGTPTRAEVNEIPILLFRQGENVYAIGATCSHAGGPLDEGRVVDDVCIECPWHQSVFDMRDGRVVHSPSTFNQPRYETRVRNGQIEIRRWQAERVSAREQVRAAYDSAMSR
jgi:nitrite reductase/ring-hydroxylating ferredoxin subunit/uncharacterized membrane protein